MLIATMPAPVDEERVWKIGLDPEGIFEHYQAIGEEKRLIEKQVGQRLLEILGEAREWIGQKIFLLN